MVAVAVDDGGEYEIEHELVVELAAERAHDGVANEPPAPPSLQAMPPVGEEASEPLVSATVAVKTTEPPAVVLAGLGVNVVVVEWDGAFATAYESPP